MCRGRALPVRCDRQIGVAPVARMEVSGDLAGEVGDRGGARRGGRRRDPARPGVRNTAVRGEGDPAFGHRVEESYRLHESTFLADRFKDREKTGEDLGGCKACGVRVNTAGRVNQDCYSAECDAK